jgi:AraC-like DNA-binding protein/flagellar biosynthesis protein FliQ
MLFEFNFYSSILLIFFVHGLVYSILLYRRGITEMSLSSKLLCCFLILCILHISPWMLGFAGWYDNQPYRDILFYIPFQHLYFIGPIVFFYVQTLLNPSFRFRKQHFFHLLPGILYLLYSLTIFIVDKVILKKYYFLADGEDKDFKTWYQLTGSLSMLFYFFASIRYFNLYKKLMFQVVSYADSLVFKWMRNFLYSFLVMVVINIVFFAVPFIPSFAKMHYIVNWWQYFSFAIIFYYIAITGYSNSIETKIPFKLNLLFYKPALLLPIREKQKDSAEEPIEDIEVIDITDYVIEEPQDNNFLDAWKVKIELLLNEDQIFRDPELTLTKVAKLLKSNPSIISRVINQGYKQNFNDFINSYRVEAVKIEFQKAEFKTYTIFSIALDCGFNSKTTFNRSFKKATGLSPKSYISSLNIPES